MSISRTICNSLPSSLGIKYSVHGEVRPVVQACSSGTAAIGDAYRKIKDGIYDLIITGGAEQLGDNNGGIFYGFDSAKTLLTNPNDLNINKINKPFDIERNGFLFAEGGACTLILESEKHIEARGGELIAEICGYEEGFEAYSLMAQNQSGKQIENNLTQLLTNAKLIPDEINYINAHGTGTISNDKVEAMVLKNVFGSGVTINSTKSILGHTFGASGAIEAGVCALSMRDGTTHKSKNLEKPINNLDFVNNNNMEIKINYAISESFAFGGHITSLLFKNIK